MAATLSMGDGLMQKGASYHEAIMYTPFVITVCKSRGIPVWGTMENTVPVVLTNISIIHFCQNVL